MAFSINTNITSLQAQYYLNKTQQFQAKTINEVTSGLRIVNSGDDAAGLAVANGYRSDQAVLSQGISNLNSATSTMQTIDSGMSNIGNLLDRARTLATQSASETFTGDRSTLNNEFQSVLTEINRQAQAVGINNGGTFAKSMSVYVGGGTAGNGVTAGVNGSINVDLTSATVDTKSLGLTGYTASSAAVTNVGTYISALGTGTATLTFNGAGFSDTGKVDVTVNLAGVTDMKSLASAINSGISQAAGQNGSQFAAFKSAGITAVIGADVSGNPTLSFTGGNNAFQVSTSNATGEEVLGGGTGTGAAAIAINSQGTYSVGGAAGFAFAAMTLTDTQAVQIQSVDSSGKLQSLTVSLTSAAGSGDSLVNALKSINTALQNSGVTGLKNIVAVSDSTTTAGMSFVSTSDFTVNINAATGTHGFTAGIGATNAAVVGTTSAVDITNSTNAAAAVAALSSAVKNLGAAQAIVGKSENVMSYATSLASTQLTNLASSESQIRDADLAAQAANLSKAQILSQAGVAALAQANSAPQAVLSLLKG
jgi:flagellin